jgi:catechol 2,3-dioxygenase-like lactoylglutathione lyase family enzyme
MKIKFKRIDHVQLAIPKGAEKKAREFYTGLLGLEEIGKPDSLKPTGGVWFKIAGSELHLSINPSQTLSDVMGFRIGIEGFNKEHPAFETGNLDEVKEFLKQNSVWLKEETPIPGRRRFSFFDPFGNRIELLEYD